MNAKRLWLAVPLAVLFYGIGTLTVRIWPYLQQGMIPYFPDWVRPVSAHVAFWSTFICLGAMTLKVLPPYHWIRIAGDLIGCLAGLVNLLIEKNIGNVALTTALALLGFWSLWANRAQHQPVTRGWRDWLKAIAILGVCSGFGFLVAWLWPVNAKTQYAGDYWGYIALAGALVFCMCIVALETRVMRGDHWLYPTIYGLGAVLLTTSYLGQYNWASLVLNSALACLTYAPLLLKAVAPSLWKAIAPSPDTG